MRSALPLAFLALAVTCPVPLAAQHPAAGRPFALGGQAVGLVRRVDPARGGRAFTEGYLVQPVLMLHAAAGRFSGVATLDFEGLTLDRGELMPGTWGEGYVDRRHPHSYLHEAVAIVGARAYGATASLAGGKGFAPFGTDDPMMRPFVAFPANHHLAQILERALVVAAVRRGPLAIEAGVFNGDEPESPGDAPNRRRFADSWSARLTAAPRRWLELQASHAKVQSPEWAEGFGTDQRKWSAALRIERAPVRLSDVLPDHGCTAVLGEAPSDREYALVEWARTDDVIGGRPTFRFQSVLAEGAVRRRGVELGLRWEQTERPEEERLANPFRSARPHGDESILGVTRWKNATVSVSAPLPLPGVVERIAVARPFVEAARLVPSAVTPNSAFVPAAFFGGDVLWSVSAGLRITAGTTHRRMGRYGAALASRNSFEHLHPR